MCYEIHLLLWDMPLTLFVSPLQPTWTAFMLVWLFTVQLIKFSITANVIIIEGKNKLNQDLNPKNLAKKSKSWWIIRQTTQNWLKLENRLTKENQELLPNKSSSPNTIDHKQLKNTTTESYLTTWQAVIYDQLQTPTPTLPDSQKFNQLLMKFSLAKRSDIFDH